MPPDDGAQATLSAARRFLLRLSRPSTILVALSGGSDSTGLLLSLHAANTGVHRIVACTVDHALRPDSAAEARTVARRCAERGIPHRIARWSHEGVTSALQARARLARYALLSTAADAMAADLIVTGHTADDQAETVAMRARRGGAHDTGLAGMADAVLFSRRIWICRPFLDLSRSHVRDFLRGLGESWIEDPSNADPRFERVRIRAEGALAPQAGSADAARRRFASSARVAALLDRDVAVHGAILAETALRDLDDPDTRRMLRILAAVLGGRPHPMGGETSDRLFHRLSTGLSATAGRVVFEPWRDRLFLTRERRDLPTLDVPPGRSVVWDGRFAIENGTDSQLLIEAGQDFDPEHPPFGASLAGGILRRALAAAPRIADADGAALSAAEAPVRPVIAPYDTFLPRFDRMIADRLSALFGCVAYPSCPVRDVSMK